MIQSVWNESRSFGVHIWLSLNGTDLKIKNNNILTSGYETATEELLLVLSVEGEGPRVAGDVFSADGGGWVFGDCPTGFPGASELASASVSCWDAVAEEVTEKIIHLDLNIFLQPI